MWKTVHGKQVKTWVRGDRHEKMADTKMAMEREAARRPILEFERAARCSVISIQRIFSHSAR